MLSSSFVDCSQNVAAAGWRGSVLPYQERMDIGELADIQKLTSSLPPGSVSLMLGVHPQDVVELHHAAAGITFLLADALPQSASDGREAPASINAQTHSAPMARSCDLTQSEFPVSLSPKPSLIVTHGQFYRGGDRLLGFKALRCSYPQASLFAASANRSGPTIPLPTKEMSGTKFGFGFNDANSTHPTRHFMFTNNAHDIGTRATLRPSGLIELQPAPADGIMEMCSGPAELDEHRMLHDCTADISKEELAKSTGAVGDLHDFFTRSHPLSLERMSLVIDAIPSGSRVLDIGCATQGIGHFISGRRSNITYCPVDMVPRTSPWRAAVCNLNLLQFPLTIKPPPTHIVLQGVWTYLYDKVLVLDTLACAYPEAVWVMDVSYLHLRNASAELNEFCSKFGYQVQHRSHPAKMGAYQVVALAPQNESMRRRGMIKGRCRPGKLAHLLATKPDNHGGCYQVSEKLPVHISRVNNHALEIRRGSK